MKIKSINVTEVAEESIIGIHSFSSDDVGVKEAEDCFRNVIQENGDHMSAEEIDECIEDGYFEQGSYQAFLTWSDEA